MIQSLSQTSKTLLLAVVFLVVFFGASLWWFFGGQYLLGGNTYNDTDATPFLVLLETNEDFARAQQLSKEKDHKAAKEAYERALLKAEDLVQAGQIEYKAALAMENSGDYFGAIRRFKEIAANEYYTEVTRAYAIERLGMISLLYEHGDAPPAASQDQDEHGDHGETHQSGVGISDEIFKDEPYRSFREGADPALAYRRLYEYSSSLFPLVTSQIRIAEWYSTDLLRLYFAGELTDEVTSEYLSIIREHFANADAHIESIKDDVNERVTILPALAKKADSLKRIAQVGHGNFADVEKAYQDALNMYTAFQMEEGSDYFPKFRYALFLAEAYGSERADDIRTLLEDFYPGNGAIGEHEKDFFRESRVGTVTDRQKKTRAVLLSAAPEFKNFLSSIGWTESDFK